MLTVGRSMAKGKLQGKVAIVTGGAKRIRNGGGESTLMFGDVSKGEVAKGMVEHSVDEFGFLNILAQNAYG